MNYGEAFNLMKAGKPVKLSTWGHDALILEPSYNVPINDNRKPQVVKMMDGNPMPWIPSTQELESNDWELA